MRKGKCKEMEKWETAFLLRLCNVAVRMLVFARCIRDGRKGGVCGIFLFFTCILQQFDMEVKC